MSATTQSNLIRRRRSERGQTLIVALAVLFILLFIGGYFVARVANNLVTAARSVDTQSADALAHAGLDFCNNQINSAPEGADWRPTPTVPNSNADPDYYWLEKGFFRYPQKGGRALIRVGYDPNPDNPNGQLLRIESIGRVGDVSAAADDPTVFVQNGAAPRLRRELIAYKPLGLPDYLRYITGKDRRTTPNFLGTPPIDHAVATIFGNPMLGDSADSPMDMLTGKPYYREGLSGDGKHILFGAPIYVNGDVDFGSDTYFYEGPRGSTRPDSKPEHIYVNGNIGSANGRPRVGAGYLPFYNSGVDANSTVAAYINQPINQDPGIFNAGDNTTGLIYASNTVGFNSHNGLASDNFNGVDIIGYTRNIPRLEPPRIDVNAYNTTTQRYQAATRDSGFWYTVNGREVNSGQFGYGPGIYVDNTDHQKETSIPGTEGGLSLRSEWLNRSANPRYWQGPFYNPPGLTIQLMGDRIRLTRTDGGVFLNPDLTPNPQNNGTTLDIPLTDLDRDGIAFPGGRTAQHFDHGGDDPTQSIYNGKTASPYGDKNSYGVNVVLYAEGNVRVRGVYGAITNINDLRESNPAGAAPIRKLGRVHLTIVSGGTAYIDGNVVRGDGYVDAASVVHMERASTCAILAKDYVTINTTQFMKPVGQSTAWQQAGNNPNVFEEPLNPGATYDADFSFGVDPSSYITTIGGASAQSPVYLMLRHSIFGSAPAAINLFVNPGLSNNTDPGNFMYHFNEFGLATGDTQHQIYANYQGNPTAYLGYLADPNPQLVSYLMGEKFPVDGTASYTDSAVSNGHFENKAFPLDEPLHGLPVYGTQNGQTRLPLLLQPGYENLLRFNLDTTLVGELEAFALANNLPVLIPPISNSSTDYLLGNAQVAPLDIHIEATLYAQERSFFVIPGYTMNPDSQDDRQTFIKNRIRLSYSTSPTYDGTNGKIVQIQDAPEDLQHKDVYPFYGEPMDVRITIFGSVAENYTASMGDQAAWMRQWGYIPTFYGSTQYYSNNNASSFLQTPIPIPDDHAFGRDPHDNNNEAYSYVPGQAALDFRTPLMAQPNGAPITPNGVDGVPISSGLRFLYNPELAMPFVNPTDATLNGIDDPTRVLLRKQRALRYKYTTIQVPGGGQYTIVQILPAIPSLPVCPNYIYAGDSDRLIGSGIGDTDNLTDLGG